MKYLCLLALIFTLHASHVERLERPDGEILKAFFTQKDNIIQLMEEIIEKEQKSISIMAYFFTSPAISKALQKAQQRNIEIKLVIDYSMATNASYNYTLKRLSRSFSESKDCNIRVYKPIEDGIMHNKIALFEKNINNKALVWTGSFNFTQRAQAKNIENVVISDDKELVKDYQQTFDKFYNKSVDFGTIKDKPKPTKTIPITVTEAIPQPA